MIRFWSLLLLFVISVHALSDSDVLKRADNLMKSSSKSEHFRAYNDYKNIYLRAIMSDDEKLKVQALRGIVKSGNKLHIDVSEYSKELSGIKPKTSYKTPTPKSNLKNTKVKVRSSHKLESAKWIDEKLVLKFDNNLKSNQINYFTLYDSKTKKHKYVFDIHASMISHYHNLVKAGINRIKLAQFDPKTIRLVIENKKEVKIKFYTEDDELVIKIFSESTKSNVSIKQTKAKEIVTKSSKTIVIDPGHGGKDPGAVGYKKYREKIVVLQIAKQLKKILKDRGYKVYMTRESDKFIKLRKRTEYANKKNADIFVSIHANAVDKKNANKANGIECYFLSPSRSDKASVVAEKENSADMSDMNRYGKESFLNFLNHHKIIASNKLAIDLQRGMLGSVQKNYKDVNDGGVREGPFWVLVGAQMPAVLVEVGFISHPKEARRLVNSNYQKRVAIGLAYGIDRYFANNH